MTKADVIFNHAVNRDDMMRRLNEIVLDDRWQRRYRHQNSELAEIALQWAKRAYEEALMAGVVKPCDAIVLLRVATMALRWRSR